METTFDIRDLTVKFEIIQQAVGKFAYLCGSLNFSLFSNNSINKLGMDLFSTRFLC